MELEEFDPDDAPTEWRKSIISNIKRTMKNFVKAITNLTPHLGPKGALYLAASVATTSDGHKLRPI